LSKKVILKKLISKELRFRLFTLKNVKKNLFFKRQNMKHVKAYISCANGYVAM